MTQLRLYRPVKVIGQDFSKEKINTIPNQNLTLRDIIARFIRKESLPIGREGIYNEDMGDLEKIANEDIVDRKERAAQIRSDLEKAKKREEARRKKELEKLTPATPPAAGSSTPPPPTPAQTTTPPSVS